MNQYKTVLAPNAPWPKWETVEKKPKKREKRLVKISTENTSLDYFLKNHEKLNNYKAASTYRTRDKLLGRFKSNRGMAQS